MFKEFLAQIVREVITEKSEKLPGGAYMTTRADMNGDFMVCSDLETAPMMILLKKEDIARMYGIAYPSKVHGKWTGDCGGREPKEKEEHPFEKAIREQSEKNDLETKTFFDQNM